MSAHDVILHIGAAIGAGAASFVTALWNRGAFSRLASTDEAQEARLVELERRLRALEGRGRR